MKRFASLCAFAAIIGGALRIAATFIPYAPHDAWLEALYGVIDLGMLFGLVGVYGLVDGAVGIVGLAGFFVAIIGLSSIVGPDANEFGVDFYLAGSAVFILGLAALALQCVRVRMLVPAGVTWLLAAAAAIAFSVTGAGVASAAAGVLLGIGFVAYGFTQLHGKSRVEV